jgi:hypothetical protein
MLTGVSAFFMLFCLPPKKQTLLWRGERCVFLNRVFFPSLKWIVWQQFYTSLASSFIFCRKEACFMPRSSKLESGFQDRLVETLKTLFPGCMVFKMDQIQGLPDLLILYGKRWASLECKRSAKAKRRPNQEYYVGKMNEMSFSRFISPENKEEVLDELQQAFKP